MVFYKHLRVTLPADQSEKLAKEFVKKFQPTLFIFSNEVSDQQVEHMHAHLEYEQEPKKQTISDFFKKHKLSGLFYHDTLKEEPIKNKLYVCKDLDIIYHNLPAGQLEELEQMTYEINEDKKKDIKLKLMEEVKKCLPLFITKQKIEYYVIDDLEAKIMEEEVNSISLRDIAKIIKDTYINKYDKLPPTKSLMFQYSVYVAQKLNLCELEVSQIYDNIF